MVFWSVAGVFAAQTTKSADCGRDGSYGQDADDWADAGQISICVVATGTEVWVEGEGVWRRRACGEELLLQLLLLLSHCGRQSVHQHAHAPHMQYPLHLSSMFSPVSQAGHAVHEDEAARTAQVLLDFIARFRIGLPIVPVPRAAPGVPRVLPVATGPPTNDGTSGGQSTGGWQPSTE